MRNIIRIVTLACVVAILCGCAISFDEFGLAVGTADNRIETGFIEETEVETTIIETEAAEIVDDVKWEVPDAEYVIDITHDAESDLEKIAWVIYMEAGADTVCDDCRRRIADVILNLVECKITNTGNDLYWPDTITGVISSGGINPYQNMGNSCAWPEDAHTERERHAVERAYRIAHEVLRGNHSEIYRKGYFYYSGANAYGHEPETAIYHCGIYFQRQRGWDNSKLEQDWFLEY